MGYILLILTAIVQKRKLELREIKKELAKVTQVSGRATVWSLSASKVHLLTSLS